MKSLMQHISEKLVINRNSKVKEHNYHPKTKEELKELVERLIKERGKDANLNDIDTSAITDMSELFYISTFKGDISEWDVSNVNNIQGMFKKANHFNQNISKWKINDNCNTSEMFAYCNIKEEFKPKI